MKPTGYGRATPQFHAEPSTKAAARKIDDVAVEWSVQIKDGVNITVGIGFDNDLVGGSGWPQPVQNRLEKI